MNEIIICWVLLFILIIALIVLFGNKGIFPLAAVVAGRNLHSGGNSRRNSNAGELKNIKDFPQSKFETNIRNVFGTVVKGTLAKYPSLDPKCYRFYTMYPDWLRWQRDNSVAAKKLEIDGYNELLGLAFEAQGPLHTVFDKKIDKTYSAYYNRLCNDAAKRKLAAEHGIGLISIDYKIPKHLLADYIKSRIYDLCNAPDGSRCKKLRCDLLEPISTYKPTNYIDPIPSVPYRDIDQERKLGLKMLNEQNELCDGGY